MRRFFLILLPVLLATASLTSQNDGAVNRTDEQGRKTGMWIKTDSLGQKVYEGRFESGIPVGEFLYYYPDGKKRAHVLFSDQGRRSFSTTFHPSGNVMSAGNYVDKKKDSLWTYYDVNGILLKEEFYANQKRNGSWKTFFDNGRVAEEIHWKEDVKNGPWLQYFSSGQIKMEASFLNGEKEGPVIFYFPSGRTRVTGQYKDAFKTGTWYYMNDSSKVVRIEAYELGKLLHEESFEAESIEDAPNDQPE